jgi:GNAT superfamily N-acetyltransferase
MRLLGVAGVYNFWIAVDEKTGSVLGTTGLYRYNRDASEAVWLAWFCVAPETRRRGVGSRLIDFSIQEAKNAGSRYLRLYTSDYPREKAAQILYESRGLHVVKEKKRLFHTVIYRERTLKNRGNTT